MNFKLWFELNEGIDYLAVVPEYGAGKKTLEVCKNPRSEKEIISWFKRQRSAYNTIRGVKTRNNAYFWDGEECLHYGVISSLDEMVEETYYGKLLDNKIKWDLYDDVEVPEFGI
jgi:hypothetical protein